jgi:luciferase family oxidoreductase group 1
MKQNARVELSVLDLAPVNAGGSVAASFADSLSLARHAEEWGYRRFWLAEHHNMAGIASAATSVLIGYVAGGTERIRVGSGGVMLTNHSPLTIAEQFGTLETLYPGRIDLGLGRAPGTDGATFRALRRRPESADDFPDQVQELLALLEPAERGQVVRAIPGAGTRVPVWLLGSSTYSAQLAAILGLPFAFAAHFAPQQMGQAVRLYRDRFRPSPWRSEPYAMVCISLVAADSDEEAERLATSLKLRMLDIVRGVKDSFIQPPIDSMNGHWSEAEKEYTEGMLAEAIVGGPQRVERGFEALLSRVQVEEVMVSCNVFDHAARLRAYEIASQVQMGALTTT